MSTSSPGTSELLGLPRVAFFLEILLDQEAVSLPYPGNSGFKNGHVLIDALGLLDI